MTGKRKQTSPIGSPSSDSFSKDQDRFLPIANVGRIMKKSLPVNAKISKEAKDTVQACVSEFISFITGEASEKCQREKRKTINGDDLLWAMTTLGFENYVGILNIYLNKYREVEGEKNTLVRQEDQPLSGVNNFNNGVINEITEVDNNTIFKDDLNSLGAQVYAKGYGDYGRSIGYGENLVSNGGINMARIYEDGNARRPMATPLHDGAEW